MHRQLTPVHCAAYYLQPSTKDQKIARPIWQQIIRTIKVYAGEPAVHQFVDFRQCLDAFLNAQYDKEYLVFWKLAVSYP